MNSRASRCLLTLPPSRRRQLLHRRTIATTTTNASSSSCQKIPFLGGPSRLTTTDRPSPSSIVCPFARNKRRAFGTATTSADGTRLFFEWLEKSFGARFGGKSLPMDGRTTAASHGDDNDDDNDDNDDDSEFDESIVVIRDSLRLEDLERLFRHEIAALRVRGFFPVGAAAELGRELASEGQTQSAQNWKVSTSRGLESSDVITVGKHPPYNIAVANNALNEYFGEVRNELRSRRGLPMELATEDRTEGDDTQEFDPQQQPESPSSSSPSQPRLWPLDLLRLELDELWPGGAGLARSESGTGKHRCMGGGLPRLMVGPTRWKKGLVHVDELAPLDHKGGCFSANVYLQLPYGSNSNNNSNNNNDNSSSETTPTTDHDEEEQPVMEIWPLGIRSKWDWYRNAPTLSHLTSQDPEGQVVLRKVLGTEHKRRICAAPGDLVLLCVQRPHCAIGFGHSQRGNEDSGDAPRTLQTRVSLQCFLQYSGSDERLTIDS